MKYMDNNESEKKEIEFDDIDENGKVTKVKKNIEFMKVNGAMK